MEQLADNAVVAAMEKFGVNLDFTENSLQQLDALLQQAHEGYKKATSGRNLVTVSIENTVRVWGSYFGEVIRRSSGGDWIVDQKNVFLQSGNRRLDPLGQVRSRIVSGPEYNMIGFFQGLKPGIYNNQDVQLTKSESEKSNLQKSKAEQGKSKNRNSIIIGGLFGIIILVGICIIGVWFLSKQGVLAFPVMSTPLLPTPTLANTTTQTSTFAPTANSTSTNTPTLTISPIPTITNTPLPTNTLGPTDTPWPTATPIYGTFDSPLVKENSISLPVVPLAFRKDPNLSDGEIEFTLLGIKTGDEAQAQAKQTLNWYTFQTPIVGQEYIAIQGHLKFSKQNDNTVETIYPYWSLTLRYQDGGDDTWSINPVDITAQGYQPIEGTFWIFFLVKKDSQPLLYFQPNLMIMEQHGIRISGAYFDISPQH